MTFAAWLTWLRRLFLRPTPKARRPEMGRRQRPCLEALEDRTLPSGAVPTYLVNHNAVHPAYSGALSV